MAHRKKPKAKKAAIGKAQQRRAEPVPALTWRFRERAPQDGRSYGNAALYAVPQTVESLVRETGQNSLDAALPGSSKSVAVRLRLIELPKGCRRRELFLDALRYEGQLEAHLRSVAKGSKATNTAARLKRSLQELDRDDSVLWLLAVEDYGASGLTGGEFDQESHFCALIRDVENSQKENDDPGGSHGLGSKTLWSCSDLLTVLFASETGDRPGKTRVIGKADLGFHDIKGGARHGYVGHGHFGLPFERDGAESAWLPNDSPLLDSLCLRRRSPVAGGASTGTTELIVAFADPKTEDDSAESMLDGLRQGVARNFWPAMVRKQMRVFLRYERADVDPSEDTEIDPRDFVPSLVEAFERHLTSDLQGALEQPGDVVSVPVHHTVPATRPGQMKEQHGEIQAEARLIIRLAEPGAVDAKLVDSVALIRGRAMVVKYMPQKNVALGARPFHAILAAGTLVSPVLHQQYAEGFLRQAEPPAHDCWEFRGGLRARYQHGAGARLNELFLELAKELKKYVGSSLEASDDVPEILRAIFRIADMGAPNKAAYRLGTPDLTVHGSEVRLSAEVECPDQKGHRVRPTVVLDTESGKGLELSWVSLEAEDLDVVNGTVIVPRGIKRVRLDGRLVSPLPGLALETLAFRVSVKGNSAKDEA